MTAQVAGVAVAEVSDDIARIERPSGLAEAAEDWAEAEKSGKARRAITKKKVRNIFILRQD
jgi:hypothetical protein